MTMEAEDLEELTGEIRRLIESNQKFLEGLDDDENEADDEVEESDVDSDPEDFEEL